jgi:4-alpha-glucanotransferase
MIHNRGSGVLLHITSLPSPYGIGDFGPSAYRFADSLAKARQRYWQFLPLNPTQIVHFNSPYYSPSAFALNTLLISPDLLVREGFLEADDLEPMPLFPEKRVAFEAVTWYKDRIFAEAFYRFEYAAPSFGYERFCADNRWWLKDHALFTAIKALYRDQEWSKWPEEIRNRDPDALLEVRERLSDRIEKEYFLQYLADRQWSALHRSCTDLGIQIIGDIPIYVAYDSADLWANPGIFKLDSEMRPTVVAGVPPDCFSRTGQLWGNPVYRWSRHAEEGYDWWMSRIGRSAELYDIFRIDHFRAFADYYEIPAGARTAEDGSWVDGPGAKFFSALARRFPCFPIIAEDLGVNTPAVQALLDRFDFPGMKILQFAFGEGLPESPHIPHNYLKNLVCYPGTHDNNTIRGWFEEEASEEERRNLSAYVGREVNAESVHREFIRLAMTSVARIAIISMQDILGLGSEARMNFPSTTGGNWEWRMTLRQYEEAPFDELRRITILSGRG